MTTMKYFQPVAFHRTESERLLLTDEASRWYLWLGDQDGSPMLIPDGLAWYLTGRPEILRLESPRMWFAVDDLPVRETATREPDQDAGELGGTL